MVFHLHRRKVTMASVKKNRPVVTHTLFSNSRKGFSGGGW